MKDASPDVRVRPATEADAAAVADIYNHDAPAAGPGCQGRKNPTPRWDPNAIVQPYPFF